MSLKIDLTEELLAYTHEIALRESDLLAELRSETATLGGDAMMQITPEQGQFLSMIIKLLGAKRTIEVGTFTGYSSLAVALALPDDGEIIACDVNPDTTAMARRYWERAQVGHKIKLHLGPAVDTLQTLLDDDQQERFDFAFIDADKSNYDTYYEQCLQLLRVGGLLIVDNVLWHNAVIDPTRQDPDTVAIRAINQKMHSDERVDISLVPIGDGMTLARKR